MSGESYISSTASHVGGGGKRGPPSPFSPAAPAQPDDVILPAAGSQRSRSPGREVAYLSPIVGPLSPAHPGSGVGGGPLNTFS